MSVLDSVHQCRTYMYSKLYKDNQKVPHSVHFFHFSIPEISPSINCQLATNITTHLVKRVPWPPWVSVLDSPVLVSF